MKTYSGELKDGMTVAYSNNIESVAIWHNGMLAPDRVLVECEWQRYEPKPKKVWGIPEKEATPVFMFDVGMDGRFYVQGFKSDYKKNCGNHWLSEYHAEQYVEAINYINEFRALSDMPVDGERQWFIHSCNEIDYRDSLEAKIYHGLLGYVASSREKAERDLAAFPKIALAHKIVTWGFHGIVTEEL